MYVRGSCTRRGVIGYLQRQVRELAKKRAYCKNTVAGKQRGKKYPAAFRAEVVMAMLGSNSICAVAKKYGCLLYTSPSPRD